MLLAALFFSMPFLALFGVFALLAPSWSWMVALIGQIRLLSFISSMRRRFPAAMACIAMSIIMASEAMSEDIRRSTYSGIPLDEPVAIRLRDTVLDIPAGYLAPWPTRSTRGQLSLRTVSFNFWMPSKRYVEIDGLSIAGFHPREAGREAPTEGQSVVRVNDVRLLAPEELGVRSPETRFRNLTNDWPHSFREEFGLLRFWQSEPRYPVPEPFLRYRNVEGSDPQILLRCTPPDRQIVVGGEKASNVCDGYVYFLADQLSFYIVFSGEDLPRWRENAVAVRDLFRSWERREN